MGRRHPITSTTRAIAISAVRAHAPELAGLEIVELGHGLYNSAYGVGDLVVRVGEPGRVGREARLLEVVAAHVSIPVPAPRFTDDHAGVLGYERIAGRPLLGRSPPPDAAQRLARFLRELHGIDPTTVADLLPTEDADPEAWLAELHGTDELIGLLRETRPEPSPRRVVAHADLGAEHILELDGTLTGIIDWSDAAITDPALDLARLLRDFGPELLEEVLEGYGQTCNLMPRVEFFARCAALEDLAYGRATGRQEYLANAERSFAWLFP